MTSRRMPPSLARWEARGGDMGTVEAGILPASESGFFAACFFRNVGIAWMSPDLEGQTIDLRPGALHGKLAV